MRQHKNQDLPAFPVYFKFFFMNSRIYPYSLLKYEKKGREERNEKTVIIIQPIHFDKEFRFNNFVETNYQYFVLENPLYLSSF